MNSLQYISTRVDSLIGSRGATTNEKDTAAINNDDLGSIPEESKEEPIGNSIGVTAASPVAGLSEPDLPLANTNTPGENLFFASLLYIPRTIVSIFTTIFAFFRRFGTFPSSSSSAARRTSENDEDVARSLQSPYGNATRRLAPKHKHSSSVSSNKIMFPTRPLLIKPPRKTLILDLDETLIHSLSRSSKFSQGQMVEIKLDNTQLATLYLVNKRPYCDQFLKAVSEWYKLVIFTASVQQYADPMIDWLEQDRKYFASRYYRQHCIMTKTGFIKDLSIVEPDSSKVVIVDNSPISYFRHPNNAVAIEGWISDPSDHSLLNLIPFLNALRYSSDVRSVLSLKQGEDAFENTV